MSSLEIRVVVKGVQGNSFMVPQAHVLCLEQHALFGLPQFLYGFLFLFSVFTGVATCSCILDAHALDLCRKW
jgi:hypothetical protein